MLWKINSTQGKIELTDREIINLLASSVVSKVKPDQEELGLALTKYLQDSEVISDMTVNQMCTLGFQFGYYYRILREKNDVTTTEQDDTSVSIENHNEPSNASDYCDDSTADLPV